MKNIPTHVLYIIKLHPRGTQLFPPRWMSWWTRRLCSLSGGASAPLLFSGCGIRELTFYSSLWGLFWFKTSYLGDLIFEWPSCDQFPVFPSSCRNAHVPWWWWKTVTTCLGIKRSLHRNLAKAVVKSSPRLKGNTIPHLLQQCSNFWEVYPYSEASVLCAHEDSNSAL